MVTTLVKERVQYPVRLFADSVTVIIRCGILLLLYSYVFKLNHGVINGTTFLFTSWSILFYFLFATTQLKYISRKMMEDVQSGGLEMILTKPISYISYRGWSQFGFGLYSFIVAIAFSVPALWLTVGIPPTMHLAIFIPTLIMTTLLGGMIYVFIYSLVGLCAFWVEDINPIFWIIDKSVMILGGSYLPIALFPSFLYKLAMYSPFGASLFVTHTMYPSWEGEWHRMIIIQVVWIIILGAALYAVYQLAKKKVSVNGG